MKNTPHLITLLSLLFLSTPTWAKPVIVTSIRPLTMIVQAIAGDDIEVRQLLPDTEEPHHYSLRVSDKLALNQADLVIWVGPELESFLLRAVNNLHPEKVLTASSLADIQLANSGGTNDPHIWLNPDNGIIIATEVSNWIAAHFPDLREQILANQQRFRTQTLATSENVRRRLLPLHDLKVLVDHDAFGHFFSFFHIQQAGALKTTSGLPASAGSLQAVLNDAEFDCIVAEPRSRHSRVEKIADKTSARTVIVDPLGADIPDSDNTYRDLIKAIASSLENCLPVATQQSSSNISTQTSP
ncbi:MAG: metal ABC transporter substrate-binding protein [Porticoccaceae bacterium]|nr:metal ABC transporter substrate-binding protein [Porticoccaceae bacterium]